MEINLTPDEVQDILNLKRDRIESLEGQYSQACQEIDRLHETIDRLGKENAERSSAPPTPADVERWARQSLKVEQIVTVRDLLTAIFHKQGKIFAIKAVRELTGLGLKDAKDLVECYWKPHHTITIEQTPTP